MEIKTKYSKDEAVWVMYHNRVQQVRVAGLFYAVGSVAKSLDEAIGTQENCKDHLTLTTPRLVYTIAFPTAMSDYTGNFFHERYSEEHIFPTKEALLQSL